MKIGSLEVFGVIYKITNKIDGKVYVGQTTKGFNKRYAYNLKRNTHNRHLKFAIEKHGIENFEINTCIDIAFSKAELEVKERTWIQIYHSYLKGYNFTLGGEGISGLPKELHGFYGVHKYGKENNFYGKHHTERTKKIISDYAKTRVGKLNPNYGNGEKIAGKNNPMYGVSPKERMDDKTYNEWKRKLKAKGQENKGSNNPNASKVINLTTGEVFDHIKAALKIYGKIAISACCRGVCKTAGKCKWMYYNDYLNMITRGEDTK